MRGVRVARCPQFSDSRFFRCVAVLVDFLSGRLHAATVWRHRKVANRKVSASACELRWTRPPRRVDRARPLLHPGGRFGTTPGNRTVRGRHPAWGDRVHAAEEILNPANRQDMQTEAALLRFAKMSRACLSLIHISEPTRQA